MDSIKTYEVSQVKDVSKHETPVEKLVYLEQIDSLVPLKRPETTPFPRNYSHFQSIFSHFY